MVSIASIVTQPSQPRRLSAHPDNPAVADALDFALATRARDDARRKMDALPHDDLGP